MTISPRPRFSLCHPTRRHKGEWVTCAISWLDSADRPELIEYVLCVEPPATAVYSSICSVKFRGIDIHEFGWPQPWFSTMWDARLIENHGRPCAVDAWNQAVVQSTGDFIITVSDDLFPPVHWDTLIQEMIQDFSKPQVLAADFSGNYPLLTFSFLTRPYLKILEERHGYPPGCVFYPEYFGMKADDDFDACARLDQVIVPAPDLKFEHRHPLYGTAEWDDTYRWQHRKEAYETGERVLARRRAEGFTK